MNLPALLPYDSPPLPKKWKWLRAGGYVLIAILLLAPIIQFQKGTIKNLKRAQEAASADLPPEKKHKGAVGRWREEIRQFWAGQNIYLAPLPPGQHVDRERDGLPTKHPNMPFVVLLLTPFAYMPVPAMALTFNLLKLLAAVAIILMTIALANHGGRRMPDWLAFLGILAGVDFLIGDIQHGNTNTFVALCVVGHLWLYRRGHDWLSGVVLACGICLKLTPALFILYWLYQREWRVLTGAAIALPLMILSPALFTDWSFFTLALGTWWRELIYPGLVEGSWYPVHVNQSLPAMIGRYFTSGDSGNIWWDPDHAPVPDRFDWITIIDLGPETAKMIIRAIQMAMVLSAAWVIGWRKLARDDGRRAIHAGVLCAMMLLLNQRTWDHHATYMILPHMALVYFACFANVSAPVRRGIAIGQLISVALLLAMSGDVLKGVAGEEGADRLIAYGTAFWHFLLAWLLCVVAAAKLRQSNEPYISSEASVTLARA